MKYALLVHQSREYFDRQDNAAAMTAGKRKTHRQNVISKITYFGSNALEYELLLTISQNVARRDAAARKDFMVEFFSVDRM